MGVRADCRTGEKNEQLALTSFNFFDSNYCESLKAVPGSFPPHSQPIR